MAFGLPASFSQYIPFNNLSKLEFQYVTILACEKLNWTITTINDEELIAESTVTLPTWNEKITINYQFEDPFVLSQSNGNQIYDRGRNKKNTEVFFDQFNELRKEIRTNFAEEKALSNYIITTAETSQTNKNLEVTVSQFYSPFSVLIPTKNYIITPILLFINILLFFIMYFSGVDFFSPTIKDIIQWGANYGPLTTDNNWWRLLSSVFIHFGFVHLIANCYALAYVGLFIESHLKKFGFLFLYLFCGLLSSLSSLYWNEDLVSAGASGAIFGMYGILLVLLATKTILKKLNANTIFFIVFFVIINLLDSFKEGIDGAAHVGGFVSGIVFGSIFAFLKTKRKMALAIASIITLITVPSISFYCKSKKIYIYKIIEYQNRMQEFVDMEKMALEAYSTYAGDDTEDVLYMIQDRGIYYWDENIKLIKELDRLYLPKNIHENNQKLELYCTLRKKVYQLAYKKIKENTSMYDGPIGNLNNQILELLQEMEKNQKE